MIVEYIRYTIEAERAEAFVAGYDQASTVLERDPHCLSWELSQGEEEPTHFVVRIEWDSVEGHLQGFRRSPAFAEFFAPVRAYIADIQEMHHDHVRAVSPTPQPG